MAITVRTYEPHHYIDAGGCTALLRLWRCSRWSRPRTTCTAHSYAGYDAYDPCESPKATQPRHTNYLPRIFLLSTSAFLMLLRRLRFEASRNTVCITERPFRT